MSKFNLRGKSKKSGSVSGLLRARARHARISEVDRQSVIERDNSICYLCGKPVMPHELNLDHIEPLELQGEHSEDNLAVAHKRCNQHKGTKTLRQLYAENGMLLIKKS